MEEQKHGKGCRCDNCELKKISGIKVSETIFEEQKHVLNCHCNDCVGERQSEMLGIGKSAKDLTWSRELTPHEIEVMKAKDPKAYSDMQKAKKEAEVAEKEAEAKARIAKWEHERRERQHLEHPFYGEANKYREDVRREQILKGAAKYPEPFNPKSWTAKELLQHAMQENVDQAHYIFGLYEKISEIEAESEKMHFSISENFELRQENENLKQEIKILKQALKGFLIFFANDKKEL